MTILNLNGYAVNVAPGSLKRGAIEEIGPSDGNYRGWMRDAVRARRRTWSGNIVVDSAASQESLEQLISGRGFHFPFDNGLYSDKSGLGPNSGYSVTLASAAPAPKFGNFRMQITSASAIAWTCEVPISGTWSMAWWFSSGAGWTHYCVTSKAGSVIKYVNGAVSVATLGNYSVSVSGTTMTFYLLGRDVAGAFSAAAYFDDLVIFPTCALNANIVAAFAAATAAQSPLPHLNLTGDLLDEAGPVEVRGKLGDVSFLEGHKGAWSNSLRTVAFSLVEANPYR
jgi:hypothetical protein